MTLTLFRLSEKFSSGTRDVGRGSIRLPSEYIFLFYERRRPTVKKFNDARVKD